MIKKTLSLNIYNDCIFKLVGGEIVYQLKVVFLGDGSGK